MSKGNSSRDFNQDISESSKTTGRESSILQNVEGSDKDGVKTSVQVVPRGVEMDVDIQAALRDAHEAATHMHPLSGPAITAVSADQDAQEDLDAEDLDAAEDSQDAYIKPLRIFNDMIGRIVDSDVHPYAKMALGVLSWSSKIILARVDRDAAVLELLEKLCEVYGFVTQDQMLDQMSPVTLGKISQQTRECAHFIRDYSEIKSFWKRLGKNIFSETADTIQKYSDVFDSLMQNSWDNVTHDVAIHVLHTEEMLELSSRTYADGAGLDTRKQCLGGTRTDILSQIVEWINSSGDSVPRVMWLSGPAGKGKSTIAHTIASWFNESGGLGSCFCFDRHREADRRHEKIFSTIALDLADRDPGMKRALADAVKNANSLKNTTNIIQQWRKLLMEPLKKFSASSVGPVLILIEALDESGGVETRSDLLRILTGRLQDNGLPQITELPSNFRILVTSRPLADIEKGFEGADHILRLSMDSIPAEVAEGDIRAFVSEELNGLSVFQGNHVATLAKNADGLFEWARLACEYIKRPYFGSSPMKCFNEVVKRHSEGRVNLLYDMYRIILKDLMPKDNDTHYEQAVAKFRSVMGQILATNEPLPLISLNAMRRHFPEDHDRYEVDAVIKHMGSLLCGTTDPSTPIRPLHATFREFLTDKFSSGEFFVERTKAQQRDLAFASLRVMEDGLRFNICDLKSSYLPNCEDPKLQERAQKRIPPHLSYSCRFWSSHVRTTVLDRELAKEVKLLFDHERLFFWLELLALINALSGAVPALSLIPQWLKGHSEFQDVSSTAMDVQRFIQVFGGIILHSTPHLYVSALPFLPANSPLSRYFSARFPNTLRVASGREINWPVIQAVLRGHTSAVTSVSFSPDGTRIVTGSRDQTIRLWDAATGQPVSEPLRGHTSAVTSVSFSPDGTRIVTGSEDETVLLWDAGTGEPVGEPLRGHTDAVTSISFSPDGTRIVTGSRDKTVRLWDAATGQPVGEPLRGHTDAVSSVSFSPDGTRIVTGSEDKTVRLWDAATGQPVGEPLRGHTHHVTSVSFSLDGTRIVTGSRDQTARLWDAVTGQPVGEPLRGHTHHVTSVSFSPDGTRIVTGSEDKTVRLWDATGKQPVGKSLRGHTSAVISVSFSPDGTRIVTGSRDQTIRLWDAATGQPVGEPLRGHTDSVSSVSFSPDGTLIVTGSRDKTVRLWDAATGQPVGEPLRGHTDAVSSVSFSQDGTRIATSSEDKTVRLWDAATGQPVGEPLRGHTDAVCSVSFSPDGTRIVTGSEDNTVRLWDAATGQPVGEPLRGHTSVVTSVSFSPDGTRIVTSSEDETVRLWDAATGQPVGEPLRGHTDAVTSISFSPDGTRIVTGSRDQTVRLWDAATGQPVGEALLGHTSAVTSVSFSLDGTRIVTGSEDNTVRLWNASAKQPLHAMSDPSSFSDEHRMIETTTTMTSNTSNDNVICFSSNSTHALRNTSELTEGASHDDRSSTPFFLNRDSGWVVGPKHQLLFWVPPASRHPFYSPQTALVIPRGGPELDLSRMAHGPHWQKCREEP